MTSVIWGSWVEINPKTADSLGIADGDLVEVHTAEGSVRAPAVLYPPIRPEVIANAVRTGSRRIWPLCGEEGRERGPARIRFPANSKAGAVGNPGSSLESER
jgi:anaerobic selenocysteine-containing dehydrogenase